MWPPGALGKKSKHTDLDIVHLQSDTKNYTDLFSKFLKNGVQAILAFHKLYID